VDDEDARMAVLRGLRFTRDLDQDVLAAQVPRLVASLKSPEVNVRVAAAQTLGLLGPRSAPAAADLADLLGDPSPAVVRAAADALAATGGEAIAPLTEALDRADPAALPAVVQALARINSPVRPSMERFRQALESDDQSVRRTAIFALPLMGVEAIPEIVRAVDEVDPYTRRTLAEALGKFGPAAGPAVPVLTAMLKGGDEDLRRTAARPRMS
jgi:HEAT repeat protein